MSHKNIISKNITRNILLLMSFLLISLIIINQISAVSTCQSGIRTFYSGAEIRDFVNSLGIYAHIPNDSDYNTGAIRYDSASVAKICELAGYTKVISTETSSYRTCEDNTMAYWDANSNSFVIEPACNDNLMIDRLVCGTQTISFNSGAEIRDFVNSLGKYTHIPNDNDPNTGAIRYDSVSIAKVCELTGFSTPAYYTSSEYRSCEDNTMAYWDASKNNFVIINACDYNTMVDSLICEKKCNIVCSSDSQCNDNNPSTTDKCINPGTTGSYCTHTPIPPQPKLCNQNSDCGYNQFCEFSACSAQQGLCINSPEVCTQIYEPVCGCDGKTYSNDCSRKLAKVSKSHDGECMPPKINCYQNSDCGADVFGNAFCENNNLFKYLFRKICVNPGTVNSFCITSTVSQLSRNCGINSCTDYGVNYCKGNSVYQKRVCNDRGCSNLACYDNQRTEEKLIQTCCSNQICSNGQCISNQCIDNDNDGYDNCAAGTLGDDGKPVDCNDNNINIHPGAVETCNLIDDDCNGVVDEGSDICGSNKICVQGQCIIPTQNITCCSDSQCNDNNPSTTDKCINPGTTGSYCTHTPTQVTCYQNSDCGADVFGSAFCQDNDVFKNLTKKICINPGTINSSCTTSVISQLFSDCGTSSCSDYGTDYCKNNKVYHSRTCNNKACSLGSCTNSTETEEQLVKSCSSSQTCSNGKCIIPPDNGDRNSASTPEDTRYDKRTTTSSTAEDVIYSDIADQTVILTESSSIETNQQNQTISIIPAGTTSQSSYQSLLGFFSLNSIWTWIIILVILILIIIVLFFIFRRI